MINKTLIGDEKDQEIARLKMAIEKFKEYDKKRKEYYSNKMVRLGQLESYMQELDSKSHDEICYIKSKEENRKLKKIIEASKIDVDKVDISNVELKVRVLNLKKRNEDLQSIIKRQKEIINKLCSTNYELNTKINESTNNS